MFDNSIFIFWSFICSHLPPFEWGDATMCYCLCWSIYDSPFWLSFRTIPALYTHFPDFDSKFFHYHLPPYVIVRVVCEAVGGGVGSHGWRRSVHGFAREIILACNLMCQPEAWCWVPVCPPVPQGTGELSSADHLWVWSCDCDSTVYSTPHMRNGFVHFHCHDLTQICNYNQSFPP